MNLQSLKKRDLKAAKKVKERVSNFDLGSVFTKRVMNDYNHIKHRYTSMDLSEYSSDYYLKKIDEINTRCGNQLYDNRSTGGHPP